MEINTACNGNSARFERVGGSLQPRICTGSDLKKILELDPAQWAVTSIETAKYSCDAEFLAFLDSDHNGKIRVDEVKEAIAWILPRVKDFEGFEKGSQELVFSTLNCDTPEGAAIANSAKFAMKNAGLPDAEKITLAEIRDHKKLISYGLSNGDGVVPPEQVCVEDLSAFAALVMSCCGKVQDLSGADGIDSAIVASFVDKAGKYIAWKKMPATDPAIFFKGENTAALYGKFTAVKEKTDEYFRLCQVMALAEGNVNISTPSLDPLNVDSLDALMKTAPIARATEKEILDLKSKLNPVWKKPLEDFFTAFVPEKTVISGEDWKNICNEFLPYTKWVTGKPCDNFDSFDEEKLAKLEKDLADGMAGKLEELIALDKSSGENVMCFSQVRKLILFQQNLFEFLNNYVSLKELFVLEHSSMLQHGELIMDGRHFSLVTPLAAIAEHKKLASKCNICVMYIETVTGEGAALKKQSYAVAVTSGDMNNLFVGKCGIFITFDNKVCDAKVVDFIQQPVSFSEALKMPFHKFGELVGRQMDKFFSARSKEVETGVTKSFTEAQTFKPGTTPPPAKPPVPGKLPAAAQTPAVSGSMMLMGGGLGIAAIGSSFAFMAQAMKNVSVWNVLFVFLCIILIFSGPLVIMSLIKLYRRSISSFLEAGGVAINKRMRLTRKMGAIFTREPVVPLKCYLDSADIVNGTFAKLAEMGNRSNALRKTVWIVVAILILLVTGIVIFFKCCPDSAAEKWLVKRFTKTAVEKPVKCDKEKKAADAKQTAKADTENKKTDNAVKTGAKAPETKKK